MSAVSNLRVGVGEHAFSREALAPPLRAAASTLFAGDAVRRDGARDGAAVDEMRKPIETLDDAMRAHIARALSLTKGRIEGKGGAAALLGVNPHTLRGKMRRLQLDWSRFRETT